MNIKSLRPLLFLLLCSSMWASFTRVQVASNAGSSGASSLTIGSGQGWSSSTAGNAIVVACGAATGTPAPTITDNKSDTYTLITSTTATAPAILALYVLPNNPGGITSITCTPNAFGGITMMAMELSGAASSGPVDQFSGNLNPFSGSNPWTSNSTAAQSTASDYGVGVAYQVYTSVGSESFTAGSGWTAVATDSGGSLFLEEQNTVSGTSAIAATGNISTTNNADVIAIAVTIKPGSSGGTSPTISSLAPNSGAGGSAIVVAGSNFGSTQGTSTVTFGVQRGFGAPPPATVTSWSSNSITAIVPASGVATGNVVVTVNGVSSNGVNFTLVPGPNITSLSSASGTVGASVTITGTNFGSTQGNGGVTFNGTAATVSSWSDTSIGVTVPSGATTGNVVVAAAGGVVSNGVGFTLTPGISSLSPTSGPVGTSVTVTGLNFGASQGSSSVAFNGTSATPTSWSNTSIAVPVPTGATSGNVVVTVNGVPSSGVSFTVTPGITSLSPTSGAVNSTVTITGTSFGASQGSSVVTFRVLRGVSNPVVSVLSWSDTSIAVSVPSGTLQTTAVTVTVNGQASNAASFTVLAPTLASLSPSSGPAGTTVTLNGSNFGPSQGQQAVAFNSHQPPAIQSWSDTAIVATVPPNTATGNVSVINGPFGQSQSVSSNGVNFTVPLVLYSASPNSGSPGTSVTLSGSSFGATQGTSTVTFNGIAATPTSWSDSAIVTPVPGGLATGPLVVTVAGQPSNSVSFTVPSPTISSLSPTQGAVGTSITINGSNFGLVQGPSTVTFNGVTASPTSWSDTQIVAPVPNGATIGNVVITAGGNASNAVSFTVLPTPTITSLTPSSGATGSSIVIAGSNFGSTQGTSTVAFNGITATATAWGANSITATVPSGATTGNVVVTAGGVASNGVSFTITPGITSVSPTSGSAGTAVTITGTNFGTSQGSSTVTFNGTAVAPTNWSNTSISVLVPNGATTGNVVVTVGGNASNGVNFTVTLGVSSVSPGSGPVGSSVTISGTGFGTGGTLTFNGTTASPTSWSAGSIVTAVPSGAATGPVVVTVAGTSSNGVNFTVTPGITSLSPTSGAAGATVTITGTNFGASQGSSTVTFNGTAATPSSWSNTSIAVPVPIGATTGNMVVTVGGVASNGASFTVKLGIATESPTFGPVGTTVTLNGTSFGTAAGTVTFNGTAATATSWNNSTIVAAVPTAATSGSVVVTVGGIASNPMNFTVTPSPSNPAATFTFNVNTTADTLDATPGDSICADAQGNCSLRAAVMESNASLAAKITKSVTITVPAGIYQLVLPANTFFNSTGGHLDITAGPVSIIGASAATTIVEAGTAVNSQGIPNGIDKVFAINPQANFAGFAASLANLTIQYGLNQSSVDNFGGGIEWDAGQDGRGTLNITNCIIANNATVVETNTPQQPPQADGGGLSLTNEMAPPITNEGSIAISGSIIRNNIAQDQGGGIFEGSFPMTLSNTQILNNQAVDNASQGIGLTGGVQNGGGLAIAGPTVGSQTVIQGNTIISGNIAGAQGGGIFTTAGVQITSATISANKAGASGGGLFTNPQSETTQVVGTNITQNAAQGDGGGVEVDNAPGNALNMSFSRIVGNTAVAGIGLNNISGTVTANDNWWGCNQGPANSPCDLVNSAPTANWLTLSNSASPATINVDTSTTLTASFLQDSAGTIFTAGSQNLNALVGLPVSFQNAIGGSLSNCQSAIQSNGTATCAFTGSVQGTDSADVVVDKATVTAKVNVQDFSVSLTPPSLAVVRGGSVNYTLTVAPQNGFTGTVNLTCSISPSGAGVTLSGCPSSLTITSGQVTTAITATATLSSTIQNYTISVAGTNAAVSADTHSASSTLSVTDFSVSVTPASQAASVGTAATLPYTVTVTPINGFTGPVSLNCTTGLPPHVTSSGCNPASVTLPGTGAGGSATASWPVSVDNAIAPGNYNLVATGTPQSGGASRSGSAALTVADFSIAASTTTPSVNAGSNATYTVTATPGTGFSGTVSLSCTSAPPVPTGVSTTGCSPTSVTLPGTGPGGSASATMVVNTQNSSSGVATLAISGTSGTATRQPTSAPTLSVGNFSLSVDPAKTANVGQPSTVNYNVTVTSISGFSGQVQLSCSSTLPCSLNPSTVTVPVGGTATSTLQVTTAASTAPGSYPASVSGTATATNTPTQGAATSLTVADFQITVTPSQTVLAGQNAVFNVNCSSSTGFNVPNGLVSLSTTFPGGVFSTSNINCPGSSSLTVSQSTLGTADVHVDAKFPMPANNVTRSGDATLTVQDFQVSVSPASQNIAVGANSANYTVQVGSLNGFSGAVTLNCSGAIPSGSVSCNPSTINVPSGGSATSTLTANTSASTATGSYNVNVTATGNGGSHSAGATLTVATPSGNLSTNALSWFRNVGDPPSNKSVSFSNTGTVPITISSISVNGAAFSLKSTTCGSTLAAGTNCLITVTYTLACCSAEFDTGELDVFDDIPGSPQIVSLQGQSH